MKDADDYLAYVKLLHLFQPNKNGNFSKKWGMGVRG